MTANFVKSTESLFGEKGGRKERGKKGSGRKRGGRKTPLRS